jgi:hypothetical protein
MLRPEHSLTKVDVVASEALKVRPGFWLGAAEGLLGAVVDAGDAERQQLDCHAGHDLGVSSMAPTENRSFRPNT